MGYKVICKLFEIRRSTVRRTVYIRETSVSLPRSGRPRKFSPRSDSFMHGWLSKSPFCPKRIWQYDLFAKLHLHKPSGGGVWSSYIELYLTKRIISPQTPHNCYAWWWRGDYLGLFCNHRTWGNLRSLRQQWGPFFRNVLETNLRSSLQQLKLRWNWVMQQGNDPKHTNKSTFEWQSPDLNPTENFA